jgi:hypothetical protein
MGEGAIMDLYCCGRTSQAIITYIHGKLSTVDEVYWLRSCGNAVVKIESEWDPHKLGFKNWWLSPEFKLERERFIEMLSGEVISMGQLDLDGAREIIIEAMDLYVMLHLKSRPIMDVISGLKALARRVLKVPLKTLLTEKQYSGLREKYYVGGYVDDLDDLRRCKNFDSFLLDEDLVFELLEIEAIIGGFYKARLDACRV